MKGSQAQERLICFFPDLYIKILHTPGESLLMGMKEEIKLFAFYGAASVHDPDRPGVIIAGYDEFGHKRVLSVGGCEYVAVLDLMIICGYTV